MKGAASFVSTAYRSSTDHNHANDPIEKESDCSLCTSARSIRNPCALRVGHAPGHVSVEYEYPRYPWNARRDCQASSRRVGWLNGGHLGAIAPKFICKSICFAAEARKYLLCCVIDGRAERRLMDWMVWILKQLTPKHLNIHKYFCRLRRRSGECAHGARRFMAGRRKKRTVKSDNRKIKGENSFWPLNAAVCPKYSINWHRTTSGWPLAVFVLLLLLLLFRFRFLFWFIVCTTRNP